jgi:predicted nucleic acid-binding protein
MIHLDTNYLVEIVTLGTIQGDEALRWLKNGDEIGASAVAWTEFLTGPFTASQLRLANTIVQKRIIPFREGEAVLAARLYNHAGRKRDKRLDCMIAATAMCSRVPLATLNQKDFKIFEPLGLRLA